SPSCTARPAGVRPASSWPSTSAMVRRGWPSATADRDRSADAAGRLDRSLTTGDELERPLPGDVRLRREHREAAALLLQLDTEKFQIRHAATVSNRRSVLQGSVCH